MKIEKAIVITLCPHCGTGIAANSPHAPDAPDAGDFWAITLPCLRCSVREMAVKRMDEMLEKIKNNDPPWVPFSQDYPGKL
jgi:hypothetical protein